MLRPIFAFADSRLLFWKKADGSFFLHEIRQDFSGDHLSAAYIGASNRDDLELYHSIFEPAMEQIGITDCDMILTRPTPANGRFLERADVILLAGGSVETGWRAFEENGVKELILRRFHEGAVLIGISAGAVQLGRGGLTEDGSGILSTFGLVPFYVGVHEESDNWPSLRTVLSSEEANGQGIGIPFGGGFAYEDGMLTPIAKTLFEISIKEGERREAVLYPESEEQKISLR